MSSEKERILVAVDDSDASERVARHVGRVLRGSSDVVIRLLHVLPPGRVGIEKGALPAGSEATDAALQEEGGPVIRKAVGILREQGFPKDAIEAEVRASPAGVDVAEDSLLAAEESGCRTIVLGRASLGRLRELFHDHPSDELVRRSEDLSIWVVG